MQISRDKKAKNQIIVLLTLTIIAYIVFVVIGMNKNNMYYIFIKRIPKLIANLYRSNCIFINHISDNMVLEF